MVAIVSGAGLGLNTSSRAVSGVSQHTGPAAKGRSGEQVYVNVATGDLVLQDTDGKLVGPGFALSSPRTYNSQGLSDFDNNDGWQATPCKAITRLDNGRLVRTDVDGSTQLYQWNAYENTYISLRNDGGGNDEIREDQWNKRFIWTDQATGVREIYQSGGQGLILSSVDISGNTLTYAYDSQNLLSSVTNSSGESLNYLYTEGRLLAQVSTRLKSGQLLTEVSYTYDGLGRLAAVSVALDPPANPPAGSATPASYVTRYAYDGASTRVAGIAQSDGSSHAFTYAQVAGSWRIASVTDGEGAVTRLAYDPVARTTTVTDALGVSIVYGYDSAGQLTSVVHGVTAVNPAGTGKVAYAYTKRGEVQSIVDARGAKTSMLYSEYGNLSMTTDAGGNTVFYRYNGHHQCVTQTAYAASPNAAHLNTRYLYDNRSERMLRFVITPEGRTTEYRYNAQGQRTSIIEYAAAICNLSNYGDDIMPSESYIMNWAAKQDLTRIVRTDLAYDYRGQLQSSTTYGATDRNGQGIDGSGATTRYVYDHRGSLLQTLSPDGASISQTIYDGLGRSVLSITGATDGTQAIRTAIRYDDASRASTLTLANGLQTTSVYDKTGRLISQAHYRPSGELLGVTRNAYDASGRLLMSEDASGKRNWILYDAAGRKQAEIDGEGSLVEYRYNANDQVTETVRYASAVDVRLLTDASGNPLTAYNANPAACPPGSASITLEAIRPARTAADAHAWNGYDAMGRLSWQIDPLGHVTRNSYDNQSRLIAVTRFAKAVDISGLKTGERIRIVIGSGATPVPGMATLTLATSGEDRTSYFLYDRDGLLRMTIDGEGYVIQRFYDAAGRLVKEVANAERAPGFDSASFAGRLADARSTMSPWMLVPNTTSDDIVSYRYYNGASKLVAQVDGAGYLTETIYDANGRVGKTIRHANPVRGIPTVAAIPATLRPQASPQDQVSSNTWDAFGRLATQTSAQGTLTRYRYDSVGHLIGTEIAADTSERRSLLASHDLQGRLVAELDAEGAALLDNARTLEEMDAIWASHAVRYTYDAGGLRASMTDANGHRSSYFYDEAGRLRFTVNGAGEITENRYDTLGRLTSVILYAARLAPEEVARLPGGLLSSFFNTGAVAALSAAEKAGGADNRITRYTYDAAGRMVSSTDASGAATFYRYNGFGQRTAVTQEVGTGVSTITLRSYDRRGLMLAQTQDAGGLSLTTRTEYDAFGRAIRSVDANGNAAITAYDTRGRVVQTTDATGAIRLRTYDAFNRVLTETDALGQVSSYRYDSAARTIAMTTPDGVTVTTVNDLFGQTKSIADGRGNIIQFRYDRNGKLVSTDTPLTHTGASYDAGGRLIESIDANGVRTVYCYDAANRLLSRTLDPDGLALTTTYRYDAFGQQIAATSPGGVVTLTRHDANGRVLSQTVDPVSPGNPDGLNLVTRYAWDQRGAMLTMTSPGGTVTRHVYDSAGRRTQTIVDPDGLRLVTSYRYDANSNMTCRTDANGNASLYAYDAGNRLVYEVDGTGAVTQNSYDAAGHVTRIVRYAARIAPAGLGWDTGSADIAARIVGSPGQDAVQYKVYDRQGRLSHTVNATGDVVGFTYDGNGNVTERIAYATRIDLASWNPDTPPSVVADPKHDQRSRTIYDALNRAIYQLGSTGDGSQFAVTAHRYDGNGNEIGRTAYAGVIAAGTPPTAEAVAAALAVIADPARDAGMRLVHDRAGRPIWRVDGAGAVTRLDYDADGRLLRQVAYAAAIGAMAAPDSVASGSADRVTLMAYDRAGRLTGSIDAMGGMTRIVYDANGNAVQQIAFAERTTPPTADANAPNGALRAAHAMPDSGRDRVTRAVFDAANRQLLSIDACGAVTQTAYDGNGNVIASTAYATLINTSALSQLPTLEELAAWLRPDPADRTTCSAFDAANREIFRIDALGHVTRNSFDGVGNLLATTLHANAIGGATAGRGAAAIDAAVASDPALDRTIRYARDAAGNLTSLTDALGATEYYTWSGVGKRLSFMNKNGALWRYDYDAAGRIVREIAPAVEVTRARLNASGDLVQDDIAAVNLVTELRYDALGNLTARTEAAGSPDQRVTRYEYDALGHQTGIMYAPVGVYDASDLDHLAADARAENLRSLSTRVIYDTFGDAVANIDVAGNLSTKAYDALGWVRYEVDALGYVTGYQRNAFGDVTLLTRYANAIGPTLPGQPGPAEVAASLVASVDDRTLAMQVDACGRTTEVRQAEVWINNGEGAGYRAAPTTRTRYNAFGEVRQTAVLADASAASAGSLLWSTSTYYHDARGQQVASVDALGYVTTQRHDAAGNLIAQTEFANAIAGWSGETAPAVAAALPMPASSKEDRSVAWAYDQADRKISQTRLAVAYSTAPDGSATVGDLTTRYAYDAVGNLTCTTVDMGDGSFDSTFAWHDALGRTVAVAAPAQDSGIDAADGVAWHAAGLELLGLVVQEQGSIGGARLIPLTTFARDAFGNVVLQTDHARGAASVSREAYIPAGASSADRTILTLYDSHGHATAMRDALGNLHFSSFDASGHLAKAWQTVSDGDGAASTLYSAFRHDALGRQIAIITPASTARVSGSDIVSVSPAQAGSVTTGLVYNGFGELVRRGTWNTGEAPDYQELFDYDAAGRLWRTNGDDGKLTVLLYNLQGQQTAQISSAGDTGPLPWSLLYPGPDLRQYIPQIADTLGAGEVRRTDMRRDLLGRVVLQTMPSRQNITDAVAYRPTIRQSFDRWGNMIAQSDPRSQAWVTLYEYNAANQVITQIQPDSNGALGNGSPVRRLYYDAAGRQVAVRDANGNLNGQRWNAQGRLLQEMHADGGVVRYAYNIFGERIRQIDAMGNTTLYDYDAQGNNISITHPGVGVYTARGEKVTGGLQTLTTRMAYDQAGRLVSQTDGAGGVRTYAYDLRNNVIATTDPDGYVSRAAYDSQGRKIATQDPNGRLATWRYDYFGALQAHRDIGGVDYEFRYDDARQLVAQSNTRGQSLYYRYDGAGQLVRIVDLGTGQTTIHAYSASGKHVLEQTQQNGQFAQNQTLSYDTLDRLERVDGQNGLRIANSYDAEGNLLRRRVNYKDQRNARQVRDLWYAYDEMNRALLVDGALNGNPEDLANITPQQGHLLRYDRNGNRIEDRSWGTQVLPAYITNLTESGGAVGAPIMVGYASQTGIIAQWYTYDSMNRLSTVSTGAYEAARTGVDESGQATLQVDADPQRQHLGQSEAILLDTRLYDGASRLVRSGPAGSLPLNYVSTLVEGNANLSGASTTFTEYDPAGRVLYRTTVNEADRSRTSIDYRHFSTTRTEEVTEYGVDESGSPLYVTDVKTVTTVAPGYDAAGNVTHYRVSQGDVVTDYSISQAVDAQGRLYDGYKEGAVTALSTNTDSYRQTSGTSTSHYDVNGFLTGITDTAQPENSRLFINDAYGNVLQKVQKGRVLRQLVINGQASGLYGEGVDPNKSSIPDEDGGTAHPNYSAQAQFNLAYRPVTNSYPAAATGQYPVQSGDTLQSIAQAAYGDSSLWYLIAEANGLSGNADLRIGAMLTVPSRIGGAHNTAATFAPYDASRIVGDTTPMLPAPQGRDDGGCGGLGQIIVIVVAVVINMYLPGVGGAIMAAIASQAVGNVLGVQDGFSWKAVAMAALSAGVSQGVEAAAKGTWLASSSAASTVARSMISNAAAQGIGVATGLQDRFSWASVAAAGIRSGVGYGMEEVLGMHKDAYAMAGTAERLGKSTLAGMAGGVTATLARDGRVSVVQVVGDAFGNAIGNSIVKYDWSRTGSDSVKGETFAENVARLKAANPLLNRQGSAAVESNQWVGSGDYDFVTMPAGSVSAYGSHYRAELNAAERDMNPDYYTSRRGYSYTVQPGDTLSGILNGDMVHVGLVAADNGLTGSNIRAGQTIFVADMDQYGPEALAGFGRYGQLIYNQDNARLAELQRRSQSFANDDGNDSDYGLMQRAQAAPGYQLPQSTGEIRALPEIGFLKSLAASVVGEPIAFARYVAGGDPVNPITGNFENFNGADRKLLAIAGITPIPGLKGAQGINALEQATVKSILRQTGGREIINPNGGLRAYDLAEETYIAIRANTADVSEIAKNTGWAESRVARIKEHIFFNEHQLDSALRRFDADPDIVNSWSRLTRGDFIKSDLELLRHEIFEAKFEGIYRTNYRQAHDAAIRAGRTWLPE